MWPLELHVMGRHLLVWLVPLVTFTVTMQGHFFLLKNQYFLKYFIFKDVFCSLTKSSCSRFLKNLCVTLFQEKFGEPADQDSMELFGLISQFVHDFKTAKSEIVWGELTAASTLPNINGRGLRPQEEKKIIITGGFCPSTSFHFVNEVERSRVNVEIKDSVHKPCDWLHFLSSGRLVNCG